MVTPTNAILTEVFTGILPDEIYILSEDSKNQQKIPLISQMLSLFGKEVKVKSEVVGEGVEKWRNYVSNLDVDIADITPGRKYMAISVYAYSKANEVRYVYIKNESQGYKVFGYIPFDQVKVIDVRQGTQVPFNPIDVKKGKDTYDLSDDSIRALINIYSLLGEVKIVIDGIEVNDLREYVKESEAYKRGENEVLLCATRAGLLRYKEEEDIVKKARQGSFFVADTNVYIKLGTRISNLIYDREYGRRLLPTRTIFNEIDNYAKSTQKGEKQVIFQLASYTFRSLHAPPLATESNNVGDVEFVNETKKLKGELDHVTLITADQGVANSAKSRGVDVIFLDKLTDGNLDGIGEFLHCLSIFRKRIEIKVNNKSMGEILNQKVIDPKAKVKDHTNYAYLLELEEQFLK
ncbi:hypothetical protein BFU36_12965 [Sulfolobus sp. A20]|nr:hypothetical protein BFU36_12965 [Sulfolobus sp. A20]